MAVLLYIILAVMPFVIVPGLWDYADLPKAIWFRSGVFLLAAVFFWRTKAMNIKYSKSVLAFALFWIWAAVSLAWAVNRYEGFITLSHWLALGVLFFVVQNININKRAIFHIVFASASAVALIGLAQHFYHFDWFPQSLRADPAATFGSCNLAGRYIVTAAPLGVVLMVASRRRYVPLFVAAFLSMAVFVYAADFRAGMLAIVAVSVFFLATQSQQAFKVAALGVLALFFVGTVIARPNFYIETGKLERLKNTAEIIHDHPVRGVGLGNFKIFYDKYNPKNLNTQDAHNDYVQIFCELGMVGFYLFLLVLALAWYETRRRRGGYDTALKMGLVVFLIIAFFSFPLEKSASSVLAALYLGILTRTRPATMLVPI